MRIFIKIATLALTTFLVPSANCYGQKPPAFNRDSIKEISKVQFDKLVDSSIFYMQTRALSEIPDSVHINIMMCLNTVFMSLDTTFRSKFMGGRYERLEKVAEERKYTENIIKVYTEWVPNRGMGFYFPELQMELYGTPFLYAWFQVVE